MSKESIWTSKHHLGTLAWLVALVVAPAALLPAPALAGSGSGYTRRMRAALSLGLNTAKIHEHINDPAKRGAEYTHTLNRQVRFRTIKRQRLYDPYTTTPAANQQTGERRTVRWSVTGGPMKGKTGTADVRILHSRRKPRDWGSHAVMVEQVRDRGGHTVYDHRSRLPMATVNGKKVFTGGSVTDNGVVYTPAIYTRQGTPLVLHDYRGASTTAGRPRPAGGAGGFLKGLLRPPWKRRGR